MYRYSASFEKTKFFSTFSQILPSLNLQLEILEEKKREIKPWDEAFASDVRNYFKSRFPELAENSMSQMSLSDLYDLIKDRKDHEGNTLLHIAARDGNINAISYICHRRPGALKVFNQKNLSPLAVAINLPRTNALNVVKALGYFFEFPNDINYENKDIKNSSFIINELHKCIDFDVNNMDVGNEVASKVEIVVYLADKIANFVECDELNRFLNDFRAKIVILSNKNPSAHLKINIQKIDNLMSSLNARAKFLLNNTVKFMSDHLAQGSIVFLFFIRNRAFSLCLNNFNVQTKIIEYQRKTKENKFSWIYFAFELRKENFLSEELWTDFALEFPCEYLLISMLQKLREFAYEKGAFIQIFFEKLNEKKYNNQYNEKLTLNKLNEILEFLRLCFDSHSKDSKEMSLINDFERTLNSLPEKKSDIFSNMEIEKVIPEKFNNLKTGQKRKHEGIQLFHENHSPNSANSNIKPRNKQVKITLDDNIAKNIKLFLHLRETCKEFLDQYEPAKGAARGGQYLRNKLVLNAPSPQTNAEWNKSVLEILNTVSNQPGRPLKSKDNIVSIESIDASTKALKVNLQSIAYNLFGPEETPQIYSLVIIGSTAVFIARIIKTNIDKYKQEQENNIEAFLPISSTNQPMKRFSL